MTRDKHLSGDEIDWLIAHKPGELGLSGPQEAFEEVRRHVAGCEQCQRIVQMHSAVERSMIALRAGTPGEQHKDCPTIDILCEIAAGIESEEEAEKVIEHAAHCDHCGPLLRQATEDFNKELTSEEESVLARLPSAQPAFQREMGRKLAGVAASPSPRKRFLWPIAISRPWIYAAAGVAGVGLAVLLAVRLRAPSADQLLARAYSEERTVELRIPSAPYAPLRQHRGSEGSALSKPASLLEADLLIKNGLSNSPNDPSWLLAKGRSELIEWRYEDAIRSFERVLETKPDWPDALRDLATAHFQRAEAENRPLDYGQAIQELSEALARQPNDPVILFNRAIVYERMYLYDNARSDWDAYLKIDPAGPWSAEARQHLDEIQKKIEKHDQSRIAPLPDPKEAASYLEGSIRDKPAGVTGSLDEEYLDIAIENWLPAFAEDLRKGRSVEESPAGQALESFSQLWRIRHGDPWTADLLSSANLPEFPSAADALKNAVQADETGNPWVAEKEAALAARLFGRLPNQAGVLRAKLEQVYALQRSLEYEKCLVSARALRDELVGRSYSWIESKLLLEQSACSANTERFEDALLDVRRSEEIAARRGFESLYVRGLSFAADFASQKGDHDFAWQQGRLGLERFWEASFPIIRGYALCASLGYLAEDSDQPWTAVAFWSEAVPLVKLTDNRATEGLARYRLATDELAIGRKNEADQELERVSSIFRALPRTPASTNYRVASEISLASVELSLGQKSSAKKRLSQIAPLVSNLDQYQTALLYYRTLADLELTEGDSRGAERSLHTAIAISEFGLGGLKNDADRLGWDKQTSEAYRSLVRLVLSQQGREETALRIWEWHRALPFDSAPGKAHDHQPVLTSLEASPPNPTETDFKRLLPALTRSTFLTYAQLSDEVVLWVYDDRGITFQRLSAPLADIQATSRRFARMCSDPSSDITLVRNDGRKLYDWLVAPVAALLSAKRTIWIETDGPLSLIPFEALVLPDGAPLLSKYVLAYRASALGESRPEEVSVSRADRVVVVGASLLASRSARMMPALPDAIREAEDVASRFPQHKLFLSEQADRVSVGQELRQAAVLHYAGHYVPTGSHSDTLLGSVLDGKVAESYSHPLLGRCKLVVLSACATASVQKLGLFDPNGIVRLMLHSGARRVVASRWNVDSAVTAKLMDGFYAALLSGQSSAEALQLSSKGLADDPRYHHPYYWAAFGVFAQT